MICSIFLILLVSSELSFHIDLISFLVPKRSIARMSQDKPPNYYIQQAKENMTPCARPILQMLRDWNQVLTLYRPNTHSNIPLNPPPILLPILYPPHSPQPHTQKQPRRPHTRNYQSNRKKRQRRSRKHKGRSLLNGSRSTRSCCR